MNMRTILSTLAIPTAALVVLLGVPAVAQVPIEKFTGFAINLNSGPSTATIDFTIERWSTDAERDQLLAMIAKQKEFDDPQPLLRVLQKLPRVGGIRTPQTLAWDLRYARQFPEEDGTGRRIVLATDRPINFQEARNQARTMDYPFTIVEIRLNKEDRGEGKILLGTKIFVDKNRNLTLENYGQQPIRFNEIRRVK